MLVDGTPARVPSINAVGLKRAGLSDEVQRALKQAHRLLYRQDLSTSDALREIETTLPPLDEIRHLVAFIRESERGIVK
jgi:UDP-N-acetylglucosamine acyltransferase